jgi:hypothetical protein
MRVLNTWQVAHHGRDEVAAAISGSRAFIALSPAPDSPASYIVGMNLDSGTRLGELAIMGAPVAMTASDESVWVAVGHGGADSDKVVRFDLNGKRTATYPVENPLDLVAAAGSVIVESAPNSEHTTISRIEDTSINQVATLDQEPLPEPGGLAVCDDTIYVAVNPSGDVPTAVQVIRQGQPLPQPVPLTAQGTVSLACTSGRAWAALSPGPANLFRITPDGVVAATSSLPEGTNSVLIVAGQPAVVTAAPGTAGTISLVDPDSLAPIGQPITVGASTPASDGTHAITSQGDPSGEPGADGLYHTTVTVIGL